MPGGRRMARRSWRRVARRSKGQGKFKVYIRVGMNK